MKFRALAVRQSTLSVCQFHVTFSGNDNSFNYCFSENGASFKEPDSQLVYEYPSASDVFRFDIVVGFKLEEGKPCSGDIIRLDSSDNSQFYRLSLTNRKLQFDFKGPKGEGSITIDPPSVGEFCRDVHTFALSRRYKVVNYTIDGVKKPKEEIERLDGLFTSMKKVTIGKEGDRGFKGCITGVKVTREAVGQKPETVEPIKEYLYDDKTDRVTSKDISKETCGPEPKVPATPTPRAVGRGTDFTTSQGSTTNPKLQAEDDDKTAIIVVVVLILVLLLVVLILVIYWYWARHKGEYHTHEDDEELKATDPYIEPAAPRKLKGEEPEKKKEWYI